MSGSRPSPFQLHWWWHKLGYSGDIPEVVEDKREEREREGRERARMDVAQLVRLPNRDQVVMGSTPTFHSGSTVASSELRDIYEVYNREVRKLGFEPKT